MAILGSPASAYDGGSHRKCRTPSRGERASPKFRSLSSIRGCAPPRAGMRLYIIDEEYIEYEKPDSFSSIYIEYEKLTHIIFYVCIFYVYMDWTWSVIHLRLGSSTDKDYAAIRQWKQPTPTAHHNGRTQHMPSPLSSLPFWIDSDRAFLCWICFHCVLRAFYWLGYPGVTELRPMFNPCIHRIYAYIEYEGVIIHILSTRDESN